MSCSPLSCLLSEIINYNCGEFYTTAKVNKIVTNLYHAENFSTVIPAPYINYVSTLWLKLLSFLLFLEEGLFDSGFCINNINKWGCVEIFPYFSLP